MCHEPSPKVAFGYIIDIMTWFSVSLRLVPFSNGDRDAVPNKHSALTYK